jgi:membrane protein
MATFTSSETLRSGTESVNQAIQQARKTSLGQFFTAWGELRAGEGAILIAWQLLFSLFPLVVGMLSILGLVLRDPGRQAAIAASITQQFPEQASDLVSFISETRDLGGIFGLVSVVGLLWSGSNLFGTMALVFDRFYGAADRSFVKQRLVAFAMMAVYAVLISVSVASTSVTGALVGLSEDILPFRVPFFAFAIGWLVSVASAVLMFLVLYRFVPNASLKLWHIWKGAVLAGVSFVLLTQIFPLYLHFLGAGFAAYKALGVFLLLMTWFYFLGLILCAGALLNAVLSGHCPAQTAEQVKEAKSERRRARRRSQDGRESDDESGGAVKVLVWTGLTAAVTSLTLIVTRRLASSVWRALTRQEPPG